ncbi:hypothetical protein GCM10010505_31680 [Kitasatospora aburaviensis]
MSSSVGGCQSSALALAQSQSLPMSVPVAAEAVLSSCILFRPPVLTSGIRCRIGCRRGATPRSTRRAVIVSDGLAWKQ